MTSQVRRLNDLGFAVDEIEVEPGRPGFVRVRAAVTNRRFHAAELERLTGIRALEGQARLLLNDLHEYRAWLDCTDGVAFGPEDAARRWRSEVYRPTLARISSLIGPGGDAVQAYCDVLELKWLRSEKASRDIGLQAAVEAYIASGPAGPEISGSLSTVP